MSLDSSHTSECTHEWAGGAIALNVSPPVRSWACALCGDWGYSVDLAGTVIPMVPNLSSRGLDGDNMIDRQAERKRIVANIQAELDAMDEASRWLRIVYEVRFPKRWFRLRNR